MTTHVKTPSTSPSIFLRAEKFNLDLAFPSDEILHIRASVQA